jgi:hypothetical protein
MNTKRNLRSLVGILVMLLILLASVTTGASAKSSAHAKSVASGGNVLPAEARPHGFSLAEAAFATAYFNTGPRDSESLLENFPFRMLYITPDYSNSFSVSTGTMLYVPVIYSDDLDAAYWPYPDVTDPAAVAAYYFDPQQLGAEYIRIIVDGQATDLGPAYAVGVVTPNLPDGGNNYTVVAAFLTPLSKGTHTVAITARFSGTFIMNVFGGVYEFEIPYTVEVR